MSGRRRDDEIIELHILHRRLDSIERLLLEILRERRHRAISATLTIKGGTMSDVTVIVGQTATAVFQEFDGPDGSGNVVAPVGAVTYSSSDDSIATVDPSSGLITAVAAGTVTISATDAGNGLSASAPLIDNPVAPVAQSATLTITAN